jgi:MFS family permease
MTRSLAVLYAGTIASRVGTFVVPYLTIYLSRERARPLAETGRIVSAGSVGLFVGNLLGGWLADHWSRKGTLLLALGLSAFGVAVLGQSHDAGWAYAGWLFVALLGTGMYGPAASAVIADATDGDARRRAYAIHYVCHNIGMGLGPILGGALAMAGFWWVFAGDVASTLTCAALLAVGLRVATPHAAGREERRRPPWHVWRRYPSVLAFLGAGFFVVAPLMGLEYAVPVFVDTELSEPLVFVGVVYSINAACILTLSLPIERWLRGRDEARMMTLAAVAWTAGLVILAVGASLPALLASTVVWTLGEIVASIVVPTYVARCVAPQARGRMLATGDALRSLAGVVMPIVLGLLWDGAGVDAVLLALVTVPAVGIAAFVAIARW